MDFIDLGSSEALGLRQPRWNFSFGSLTIVHIQTTRQN